MTRLLLFAPRDGAIGASVELADDDMLGVEQERGDRKARIFVEGIPSTIRDLEIVGLPAGTRLVDASSPRIALAPGDGTLPGPGRRLDQRHDQPRRRRVHGRPGAGLVTEESE